MGLSKKQKLGKAFFCEWPGCRKGFGRPSDRSRHIDVQHLGKRFFCPSCEKKTAMRKDKLVAHLKKDHNLLNVKGKDLVLRCTSDFAALPHTGSIELFANSHSKRSAARKEAYKIPKSSAMGQANTAGTPNHNFEGLRPALDLHREHSYSKQHSISKIAANTLLEAQYDDPSHMKDWMEPCSAMTTSLMGDSYILPSQPLGIRELDNAWTDLSSILAEKAYIQTLVIPS